MPRTAPAALSADESANPRLFIWLFKVTLPQVPGVVLRYAQSDFSVAVDVADGLASQTWSAAFGITRAQSHSRMDMQVDSLPVTLPNIQLAIGSLGSATVSDWARLGIFDDAFVDMFLYDIQSNTTMWHSRWFVQGSPRWSYESITFHLENEWGIFDVPTPRTIIQESCNNKLYDQWCTVNAQNFSATGTVAASPSPTTTVFGFTSSASGSGLPWPPAAGVFALGVAIMVSGADAPVRRMVLANTTLPVQVTLAQPLPVPPAAGDQVVLRAGCDKTAATCQTKFNNLPFFRGFPYVPKPDTVYA